jgi:hypothetical protein
MNARAVTSDVLLGMVPIALLIGLWQAIDSFGYAPASLLPPRSNSQPARFSKRSLPRCFGYSWDSRLR